MISASKAEVPKNACDVSRRVLMEKLRSDLIQNQACLLYAVEWFQLKSIRSISDLRFEYEHENDFSILLCRLHIINSHTHSSHELHSLPNTNMKSELALETSLV